MGTEVLGVAMPFLWDFLQTVLEAKAMMMAWQRNPEDCSQLAKASWQGHALNDGR